MYVLVVIATIRITTLFDRVHEVRSRIVESILDQMSKVLLIPISAIVFGPKSVQCILCNKFMRRINFCTKIGYYILT